MLTVIHLDVSPLFNDLRVRDGGGGGGGGGVGGVCLVGWVCGLFTYCPLSDRFLPLMTCFLRSATACLWPSLLRCLLYRLIFIQVSRHNVHVWTEFLQQKCYDQS